MLENPAGKTRYHHSFKQIESLLEYYLRENLLESESDSDSNTTGYFEDRNNFYGKYCLGLTEIYHRLAHGYNSLSAIDIESHFLLHSYVNRNECFESMQTNENFPRYTHDDTEVFWTDMDRYMHSWYVNFISNLEFRLRHLRNLPSSYCPESSQSLQAHPIVRNYLKIATHPYLNRLQIVEVHRLETGEDIAILKTFWIRIFQRKWKRICPMCIKRRAHKYIMQRQITGDYPSFTKLRMQTIRR